MTSLLKAFTISAIFVLMSCGGDTIKNSAVDHSKMNHAAMDSAPNAADAPYDLQFLDTMIVHHQGAVDMAKVAETKAGHDELKGLSRDVSASQQAEIDKMRAMREERFPGAASAVNMDLAGMRDSMKKMDMAQLGTLAGTDFDVAFIDQMVPHHLGAMIMGNEAMKKSENNDVKILAESILKAQGPEVRKMSDWKMAWLRGVEAPAPFPANEKVDLDKR
ncbi:MAG: DUF305 domain-containing protein [Pyrinomonadaceae bacterium]